MHRSGSVPGGADDAADFNVPEVLRGLERARRSGIGSFCDVPFVGMFFCRKKSTIKCHVCSYIYMYEIVPCPTYADKSALERIVSVATEA